MILLSKPATEMRLKRATEGFTQVVARYSNGIKTYNPVTRKFSLDVGIGGGWYRNNNTEESDSAWVDDTGAWQYKVDKLDGFRLNARNTLNAGNVVQWTDVASGETITFQPLALNWVNNVTDSRQQITQPQAVTAQVADDVLYFPNGYGAGRHFKYIASVSRLNKLLIIDSVSNLPAPTVSNPYLEIEFIITPSSGVSLIVDGVTWDKKTKKNTANAIAFKLTNGNVVWSFAAPMAYDSVGSVTPGILQLRKQGANFYVTVRFPKNWIDSAQFPITLDPTVDYTVGEGADDCSWISTVYSNSDQYLYFGRAMSAIYKLGIRFTGVTIPDGATIDASYLTFYFFQIEGTPPACTLSAEDAAAPTQITSYTDGNDRTLTTANISVTGPSSGTTWNTGSINTIIAELIASYSYASGSSMQFIVVGGGASGTNRSVSRSYDYSGTDGDPKLHIVYTIPARAQVIWI